MKDYYKINEISKLYGIGVDSLRYYEKIGVLKPRRGENNYRLYSLKDIYKLNAIRDLRQLGFSMEQIKEYLDHQSVENTKTLFQNEQNMIKKQMKNLRAIEKSIHTRMAHLDAMSKVIPNQFTVKTYSERPCLQLNIDMTKDEEFDFAIKRLHKKNETVVYDFGNQSIGASLSKQDIDKGIYNLFHSVFFLLEDHAKEYDFKLPASQYLSVYYRGDYSQSANQVKMVLEYVEENGYSITGDILEIYHVDNRYSTKVEEFVTEIQVQVS